MATYEVLRGNEMWALSGGGLCYRVSTTGLGIAPTRRLRQRGPFQQGVSDRGFRIDERTLLLELFFQATSLADGDARRDILAEIFKPTEIPLNLRVTRDDGQVRQIDCYAEGMLDFPDQPTQDRLGVSQRVVASLYCPEPVWYNPELRQRSFQSVLGALYGFQVPMEVAWEQTPGVGLDAVESIAYAGNWQEFPVIEVTGPVAGFSIRNQTTDELLDFDGTTIAGGEVYTIDLRYERQTVVSSVIGNAVNKLTTDSDLANWHLAANPEAPGGVNVLEVAGGGTSDATRVRLLYYDRYISN